MPRAADHAADVRRGLERFCVVMRDERVERRIEFDALHAVWTQSRIRRFSENDLCTCVLHDVAHTLGGQLDVDRHGNDACAHGAEHGRHEFVAVR